MVWLSLEISRRFSLVLCLISLSSPSLSLSLSSLSLSPLSLSPLSLSPLLSLSLSSLSPLSLLSLSGLCLCVSVCLCLFCFPGGHDVQFRSLLDGSDLHSHHLSGVWCGLQSVSWDSSIPAIKPWTYLSLWSPEVCVMYTILKVLSWLII